MREELIINGQHCDLEGDTGITLEYISNLLNEPGKISLSHSYTVKLPRTANNARILDLPELPAHESSMARRYLPVHYYRNGINLIGDNAHAYITSATDEQYELVLVWDDIPELRALSESDATINDLPGLPTLLWKGGKFGDETNGAFFAKYVSTTRNEPVLSSTNGPSEQMSPVMRMGPLLRTILETEGIDYQMPEAARNTLDDLAVLATGKTVTEELSIQGGVHAKIMEITASYEDDASGDIVSEISWMLYKIGLDIYNLDRRSDRFGVPLQKMRLRINTTVTAGSSAFRFTGAYFSVKLIQGNTTTHIVDIPFKQEERRWLCYYDDYLEFDQDQIGEDSSLYIQLVCGAPDPPEEGWGTTDEGNSYYWYQITEQLTNPDGSDIFTLYALGGELTQFTGVGYYPIKGNLPELTKWELLKSACAICGLSMFVKGPRLILTQRASSDLSTAEDWTRRVIGDAVIKPRLSDEWARENVVTFADNPDWPKNAPSWDFALTVNDDTAKASRDWMTLPFSASYNNQAIQYKASWDSSTKQWTYESQDISPRFFKYDSATQSLQFTPDLYGEGLKAKYAALQAALEKPVVIEATVRLTEIDLATLDLTRPVYLAQFGRYYHVLKVQTGKTDECKVELLQLR